MDWLKYSYSLVNIFSLFPLYTCTSVSSALGRFRFPGHLPGVVPHGPVLDRQFVECTLLLPSAHPQQFFCVSAVTLQRNLKNSTVIRHFQSTSGSNRTEHGDLRVVTKAAIGERQLITLARTTYNNNLTDG